MARKPRSKSAPKAVEPEVEVVEEAVDEVLKDFVGVKADEPAFEPVAEQDTPTEDLADAEASAEVVEEVIEPEKPVEAEADFVDYTTSAPAEGSFDIRVAGKVYRGRRDASQQYVFWRIPKNAVERFEQHTHFLTGRVVRK